MTINSIVIAGATCAKMGFIHSFKDNSIIRQTFA